MDDKELIKKLNLKSAFKRKPINKLKDILKLYDEEWLIDFYYVITKEKINEGKQKLINKIFDLLTNEDIIHNFLNTLKESEYNEIVKIIENNGELQDDYIKLSDYHYFTSFGIVFTFNYKNTLYVIIPEEIINIINNLNIDKYHKKAIENSKLVNLAYSMLNLYGAVPFNIFFDVCCKYYNYNDYKEIDLNCIFKPERMNNIRGIETDINIYMVKEECLEDYDKSIIFKIISRIEDDVFEFDFKEISLDELLKYNNMFYYEETNAVIEFKAYLKNNGMSDENIDLLTAVITQTFREDYNDGILFLNEIFAEENFDITEDNIDEILSYINNIVNNIPLWGNKGWTNKEIILGKCYE